MTVDRFLRRVESGRILRRRAIVGGWALGLTFLVASLITSDIAIRLGIALTVAVAAMLIVCRRPLSAVADDVDRRLGLPQTLGTFVRCDSADRLFVAPPAKRAIEPVAVRSLVPPVHPVHLAAIVPLFAAFLTSPKVASDGLTKDYESVAWSATAVELRQQSPASGDVATRSYLQGKRPGRSERTIATADDVGESAGSSEDAGTSSSGDGTSTTSATSTQDVATSTQNDETRAVDEAAGDFNGIGPASPVDADGFASGTVDGERPSIAVERERSPARSDGAETLDRRVPAAYRDLVRRYFSGD